MSRLVAVSLFVLAALALASCAGSGASGGPSSNAATPLYGYSVAHTPERDAFASYVNDMLLADATYEDGRLQLMLMPQDTWPQRARVSRRQATAHAVAAQALEDMTPPSRIAILHWRWAREERLRERLSLSSAGEQERMDSRDSLNPKELRALRNQMYDGAVRWNRMSFRLTYDKLWAAIDSEAQRLGVPKPPRL